MQTKSMVEELPFPPTPYGPRQPKRPSLVAKASATTQSIFKKEMKNEPTLSNL